MVYRGSWCMQSVLWVIHIQAQKGLYHPITFSRTVFFSRSAMGHIGQNLAASKMLCDLEMSKIECGYNFPKRV